MNEPMHDGNLRRIFFSASAVRVRSMAFPPEQKKLSMKAQRKMRINIADPVDGSTFLCLQGELTVDTLGSFAGCHCETLFSL